MPNTINTNAGNSNNNNEEKLIRELVRKRGIIKGRLTKFANYLNGFKSDLTVQNRIDIKLRKQGAADLFKEFNEIQSNMESTVRDCDLNEQSDQRELFEDAYYQAVAKAEFMLKDEAEAPTGSDCTRTKSRTVKLPTITMPSFDGSYEHWLEFRDTFHSLVHNSKEINPIEKFHYLKLSLKGSAALVIESLEFSALNYSVAWELLLNRYNNSRLLVHNHVRALFSLPALTKESPNLIRMLIDTVLKNLRALKILGEPTGSWDTLIIFMIVSKLDKTTEREWEQYKSTLPSNNDTLIPLKVDDMISYLKGRADMLETLLVSHSKDNKQIPSQRGNHNNTSHCSVSTNKPQAGKARSNGCLMCNASHPLYACQKFLDLNLDSRLKFATDSKLCTNCLRSSHALVNCRFGPCRKCDKKHNSLLHSDELPNHSINMHTITNRSSALSELVMPAVNNLSTGAPTITPACDNSTEPSIHVNNAHTLAENSYGQVLLSTAVVKIKDTQGNFHSATALLDNGSQRSFITQSLCDKLGTTTIQSTHSISGVGGSITQCTQTCDVEINSRITSYTTHLRCYVLPHITSPLPAVCPRAMFGVIPNNIQLADPHFSDRRVIDLLIGADTFWDLISEGQIRLPDGPFLQKTKLGWVVSGPIGHKAHNDRQIQCNFTQTLDTQLRKFWELEELPRDDKTMRTTEELACEDHFVRTTTRNDEGRFIVSMPLKKSPDTLGETFSQAERRFLSLEKRLQRSTSYKQLYSDFIHEYEDLGHMTRITTTPNAPHYFMPHHGVFREHSTTTKLRVVFDASAASSSGTSLNDIQLVGAPIQGDLFAILLRFRQHRFVACADVAKMYRQVLIDPQQRDLQLILWRDELTQPISIYKLNTVTYGTASAPFMSVRCLKQLAADLSADLVTDRTDLNIDREVRRIISEDFYVDDMITGFDDKDQLLQLCDKTAATLQAGCFPLRKWIFNFSHDRAVDDSNAIKLLTLGENTQSKTLGLGWFHSTDEFHFDTQFQKDTEGVTKRIILSTVSQIFDPLGLLSPTIMIAKVLLQQLWLLKIDWDDALPSDVTRAWDKFVTSLSILNSMRVPRHAIGTYINYIELHVFSDASQTAYGACIYVRTVTSDGNIVVRLLCSKGKVAPLKPVSIPRLELCGAQLGARLYGKVQSSMHCQFSDVMFWTDSTIVLGWLKMSPNLLKTFVQNRTAEIHEIAKDLPWRHVSGKVNPADLVSRGVSLEDLSNSTLWWEGPAFLRDPNFNCSQVPTGVHSNEILPELKQSIVSFMAATDGDSWFPFNRFSQLTRMVRAVAFVKRFIQNTRYKNNRFSGVLSIDELRESEKTITRLAQSESFPELYRALKGDNKLKSNNNLSKLNLFLDDDWIIRVGGRLENSPEFDYNKKHPVLLLSKHFFTTLLFRHEHRQMMHAAPQALLFHLREAWWPIGGRSLARKVVHDCVTCKRIRGKTITPLMGNLPKERISPSFPFLRSGVDYAGPVLILNRKGRGARTVKAYICIFICFITRAVHLELVSDLTSDAYLLALKRFISRRGKPAEIHSDNAKTFVGLMNEFADFLSKCSSDIIEFANSQNIKFKFIPPYSPHFGGLWEAGVKSCKYHLRRVVGNAHLTFEEFSTVLAQVEAILNSRPLTPLSSDSRDFLPLSPAHFLVGRPLTTPACDDVRDTPTHRLTRYRRLEQIRQHFWSRWANEYISELQTRTKWRQTTTELTPNTLVLIKDMNLPPLKWQMGRIISTLPGKDGIARVAEIQTPTGITRRVYAKICPLVVPDQSDAAQEVF